ncbi:UDP-N-acetylmuramoyl-tripeptide--D-alanyl-D-alanine ligase [Suilimivivens sp.]|uniref:UDP-N-acetylmuramoyl-tripeptide--D-alanyl-D- alanine ligase n=1 Tax=Suilimivivens sp. TaxID=2981669 RepID=UPI00307A9FE3
MITITAISILCAVLTLPAFLYVLRYNLHMFQLNGYKNGEHIHWLKKNVSRQYLLILIGISGILSMCLPGIVTLLLQTAAVLICMKYYLYLKKTNTKKKLVYTARVKRLILTDSILVILLLVLTGVFLGVSRIAGAFAILTMLQIIALVIVNWINRPVEGMINQHYINDAKKKLRSVPDLTVIGVTGSYGKTSVKYYLDTLLKEHFEVLITPESYNTPMGVVKTIRSSLKPSHQIFICEMGARHVGDIKEICDIVHPEHGIITSVGPQHLETFFNMDNIVNTKFELADALPEVGLLFLNGDNEYIRNHSGKYKNKIFYTTGEWAKARELESQIEEGEVPQYYQTGDVKLSRTGTEFTVTAPDGEKETFQMRLLGEHNVINVAGAVAVANTLGIPLKQLKVPVRRIQPVAHRMQLLERGNYTIIDDAFNSNPVGSRAAVETLKQFEGVRILITPGMVELGEKEEEYNYKFGTYAADCCDYILLVGEKHTAPIHKGVLESGFSQERCRVFEKLEDALSFAYSIKAEGHKFILLENDLPDNY